jgi:hypothetical protein
MELTELELEAVANVTKSSTETCVAELSDMQLVLVGGGTGDVIIG